jgi:hypothetical protein
MQDPTYATITPFIARMVPYLVVAIYGTGVLQSFFEAQRRRPDKRLPFDLRIFTSLIWPVVILTWLTSSVYNPEIPETPPVRFLKRADKWPGESCTCGKHHINTLKMEPYNGCDYSTALTVKSEVATAMGT